MAGGGSNLLNVGVSGLLAFQRALGTTGHNISNVNTDSYSRQNVDFSTRHAQFSGYGYQGSGVQVDNIARTYDDFLTREVRSSRSTLSDFTAYHEFSSRIDNLLADPEAGLSSAMQSFFDSVQDVADNPSSTAVREVMLGESEGLSNRFGAMNDHLERLQEGVNLRIDSSVDSINGLTSSIAKLNSNIVRDQVRSDQRLLSNDLLDKRDNLLKQLSEHISVSSIKRDNGSIDVFMGRGQGLVMGTEHTSLEVVRNGMDGQRLEVRYSEFDGVSRNITEQLKGGELGGLLQFRQEVLVPSQNAIGRLAIGLAATVNAQHQKGLDLNGTLGEALFSVGDPVALPDTGNSNPAETIEVDIVDVSFLGTDDYVLKFDAGQWGLANERTGKTVAMTGSGVANDPFVAEGLAIRVDGLSGVADKDRFLIRPVFEGADTFSLNIHDPEKIAASSPIRTLEGDDNVGTGQVSAGKVLSIENLPLINEISFTFSNTATTTGSGFIVNGPGALAGAVVPFSSATDGAGDGKKITLYVGTTGPGSWSLTDTGNGEVMELSLSGRPAPGDSFSITHNNDGTDDNRNALLLNNLQTEKTLHNGGTADFHTTYGQLVTEVGSSTLQAEVSRTAHESFFKHAEEARSSLSGVNLDEEAAQLIEMQQAYQATAQVISTAQQVFQTLLSATGR